MKKQFAILQNYVEDIFIGAGLLFINVATFKWNTIAGLYCLGVSCLALGITLARHPPGRR